MAVIGSKILARLHRDGFTVRSDGSRIGIAPSRRLREEDRALVRAHRGELLEALPSPQQAAELRSVGQRLGAGGSEWAEREIRSVDRQEAERLLSWLRWRTYER